MTTHNIRIERGAALALIPIAAALTATAILLGDWLAAATNALLALTLTIEENAMRKHTNERKHTMHTIDTAISAAEYNTWSQPARRLWDAADQLPADYPTTDDEHGHLLAAQDDLRRATLTIIRRAENTTP